MHLANIIADYYKNHFSELSTEKQFHFATRLSAWNQDAFCLGVLEQRTDITHGGDMQAIKTDLKALLINPPTAKINAAKSRERYFVKYPDLRGRMLALFRVRHLLVHYAIDARPVLLELCPLKELTDLSAALMNDELAVKTLSTYAINYIYLVHSILFEKDTAPSKIAELAYEAGNSYDLSSPEQIQLLIYLYTHCIIGETNFYVREIARHTTTYHAMLERLEAVIQDSYDVINLDNKLEFLVCCRIMGHATNLFEKIDRECRASLSPEGTFVIDTHNSYKQSNKTSFNDSEHRNVLLVMSASPYPHSSE
ncbi:hypothetical protein PV379_04170 [Streptomyces caniscabiei]|uniref:hypothetical protein n=1 Tax=Streptomyces caniscabiei TaxID=2746961 RepID=UPI0029AB4346|nr:hypothetical protein [Streptomyces caniscabiei]MDX2776533.1 hypothetical protein [Streptomyces caniscabiei]